MINSNDGLLPEDEKTEIIYDLDDAITCGVKFLHNVKEQMGILSDHNGPSLIIKYEIYKNNYISLKNRGVKTRFVTEITKDNIRSCRELRKIVSDLRHLDGLKGTISVHESEFIGTATWSENQLLTPAIYSNEKRVVEQQQYIFDTFWEKAIPAEQRIMEIENGIEPEVIETSFSNIKDIRDKAYCILNSAKIEILVLFSTYNTFHRQANAGLIKKLKEIASSKPWISIKILTPKDQFLEKIVDEFYAWGLNIRLIEPISKVSILIVDKKHSLVAELKEDFGQILTEQALGFVTYSNSQPTVLTYASIFDSLWKQSDMFKQLQLQDKIHMEFINTAAHELRTPIQPILGMADLIKKDVKNDRVVDFIDIISRNAKRLKNLSENILDSTRIESNSYSLIKEYFDLDQVFIDVINSFKNETDNKGIKLECTLYSTGKIYADKTGITKVISNLISNSIKFSSPGGNIYVGVEKKGISGIKENDKEIIITSIKDTGTGISEDIFSKLFTKFSTTSFQGMGLGLFISKNIVEAHGGKIWAENNKDGKGATFSFSLPLKS